MMGRTIGIVYGAPLAYFAMRGRIPRSLAPTLAGLLVLGGSQGLVGWWMVKSGMCPQDSNPQELSRSLHPANREGLH